MEFWVEPNYNGAIRHSASMVGDRRALEAMKAQLQALQRENAELRNDPKRGNDATPRAAKAKASKPEPKALPKPADMPDEPMDESEEEAEKELEHVRNPEHVLINEKLQGLRKYFGKAPAPAPMSIQAPLVDPSQLDTQIVEEVDMDAKTLVLGADDEDGEDEEEDQDEEEAEEEAEQDGLEMEEEEIAVDSEGEMMGDEEELAAEEQLAIESLQRAEEEAQNLRARLSEISNTVQQRRMAKMFPDGYNAALAAAAATAPSQAVAATTPASTATTPASKATSPASTAKAGMDISLVRKDGKPLSGTALALKRGVAKRHLEETSTTASSAGESDVAMAPALSTSPTPPSTLALERINTRTHKREWMQLDRLMNSGRAAEFPHMQQLFHSKQNEPMRQPV